MSTIINGVGRVGIRVAPQSGGGGGYTTRTQAFATATGIADTTILNALNTFDLGLISNGLDTKMKALYPFVGGTANTHKFNFMNTTLYQITWNGGITHSSNGFQGNGINGYGNTGLNAAILNLNNTSIGSYLRTNIAENSIDIGCTTGAYQLYIFPKYSDGRMYRAVFSDNSSISMNNTLGLFIASRLSSTSQNFYKNGISTLTTSENSTSQPNLNILIGASGYISGGAWRYSTRQHAFDFIGDGLTDAESTTFYNLVQTLQTSLGRQV